MCSLRSQCLINHLKRLFLGLRQRWQIMWSTGWKVVVLSPSVSHRFRCPGPGSYQCALTGLGFVMKQEAELLYRTVQWDERPLQSAGKMAAGLLFDIKSSEDAAVDRLHLPHCELTDGNDILVHFSFLASLIGCSRAETFSPLINTKLTWLLINH